MAEVSDYSRFDRLVHKLAFSSPRVQLSAADMEDSLFKSDVEGISAAKPIFVTSLPRAGTTILLTALNSAPELATHVYRDMPFVMAPLMWSRISGGFRKQAALKERAHGDGIQVGFDSPEAFEEIIWRAFWPEKYHPDGIALWTEADADDEATAFFVKHFRKIIALRGAGPGGRYVSKNNGNIARLDLIATMFPDADILVPMRSPLAHAGSLHRQHLGFLERHGEDPFAERYMRDIGHYEFGALHRPIRFAGLSELTEGLTPGDLDYWLAYWIAAFEHISARSDRARLVGYEALCAQGPAAGRILCDLVGLDPFHADKIGGHFRPAPPNSPDLEAHRSTLRDRAEALHASLIPAAA